MSILGNRVRRVEDPRFLPGPGTYLADLRDPRLERGRPPDVRAVDVRPRPDRGRGHLRGGRRPRGAGGVHRRRPRPGPGPSRWRGCPAAMARPWLASDTVRFVGEPVVVIVTDTPTQGEDAAELVIVDVDPLPAVIGVDDGLTDEVLLFPEAGDERRVLDEGWDDTAATGDDVTGSTGARSSSRARVVNQRVAGVPLEGRGSAAVVGRRPAHAVDLHPGRPRRPGRGRHRARPRAAPGAGHHPRRGRRVRAEDHARPRGRAGGLDGPPARSPRPLGRDPQRRTWWRRPTAGTTCTRCAIGGTRDGRVLAYELDILADAGAYPLMGAFLPYFTRLMATGVYDIPRVRSRPGSWSPTPCRPRRTVAPAGPRPPPPSSEPSTCSPPRSAWTRPRCGAATSSPADAFPYTTAAGAIYDVGDYEDALDRALAAAGYDELRAEQARRRDAGDRRAARHRCVHLRRDHRRGHHHGVRSGAHPPGRRRRGPRHAADRLVAARPGPATALAMVVSDVLGTAAGAHRGPPRRHRRGALGHGHHGQPVAADGRVRGARRRQQVLEAGPRAGRRGVARPIRRTSCSTWTPVRFHVVGTPSRRVDWARVAAAAAEVTLHAADGGAADEEAANPLWVEGRFETDGLTFPFGAHVAVVEVDGETGLVDLVRLVACDDAGRIVNPLLAEGQRHGGIAQGVAQALFEEVRYDDDGNPLTATLADYGIPSAAELPRLGARGHGDAHAHEPARRQGHRRVRHHRCHPGGAVRRGGRRGPPRRPPHRPARSRRRPSGVPSRAPEPHRRERPPHHDRATDTTHRGHRPGPHLRRRPGRRRCGPARGATARCSASSGPTAPGSPPRCACSPPCCAPPTAGPGWPATTWSPRRPRCADPSGWRCRTRPSTPS